MRLTAFPDAPSGQTEGEDEKQRLVRVREHFSPVQLDRFSALNLQRSKSQKESVIIYLFFADPTIYRRVFRYGAL